MTVVATTATRITSARTSPESLSFSARRTSRMEHGKFFCKKDDKFYSKDPSDDKFVCEVFVEILDIETWEDDCDHGKDYKDEKGRKDGKKDDKDHKYYDTSCWNAHYNY
ncbi:hypothetical protein IW262DRAFT_1294823 [Armillaria fumosa]|nr:hypothetical protein IW262DRAFT_1294823 [Armillaria fumosa]